MARNNTQHNEIPCRRPVGIRLMGNMGTAAALLAIVLLGAALRLYGIHQESAWCDEALTLQHLPAPDLKTFLDRAFTEDPRLPVAPVYYVLQFGWARFFGASVLSLRLFSVATALLSLVAFYGIAARLYGVMAGMMAAWALALSLPHIYYSQEVRFYALLCLFALASMWGMIRALWDGRWWGWPIHFLANVLMLWTHAFSPLFFAAQGAFLFMFHMRRGRMLAAWGGAHAGMLAAYAMWMRLLAYDFSSHSMAYAGPTPSLRTLANVFVVFCGGRFSNENPAPYLPGGISYDYGIALMVGFLTLFLGWRTVRDSSDQDARAQARDRAAFGLALIWAILPAALLFLAAWLWKPCFIYRYVLFSLFGWCLLIGAGIARLPRVWPRLLVTAVLCALYGHQVFALARPFRPDYAHAARIAAERKDASAIYAFKTFNAVAARYYFTPDGPPLIKYDGFEELCTDVPGSLVPERPAWVLFHRWERTGEFERRMNAAHCRCVGYTFGGIPPLQMYRVERMPMDTQYSIDVTP